MRRGPLSKPIRIVSILLLVLPTAWPAFAQARSGTSRPFRGLFGPREIDERRPQKLDLTLSVYAAFEDNSRFTTESEVFDATLQARRPYQGVQAALSFTRRRPRSLITFNGSSALRYYSDLHRATTAKHGGGIGVEFLRSSRWKFQLSQNAAYSPYYQLALGLSAPRLSGPDIPMASPDYSVWREQVMVWGSFAGVTYSPSRRAEVTLNAGRQYTDFFTGPDFSALSAGARFTYQLAPDVGLRLGYANGSDTRSGLNPIRNHNLDLGLEYKRAFSFTRRTSFGFTSGSTMVSTDDGRHVQLTGSARLSRQLSPRWTSQIVYERGLQVLETAPRPFFSGTISGNLSGYCTPRITLRWLPVYTRGVDVADDSKTYTSYSSQARLDTAVSRYWAVYVEHFYYEYRFSAGADLPSVLKAGLVRRGVRAGLTLWTPLIR